MSDESMDVVERDRETLAELARVARDAWDEIGTPHPHHVDPDNDSSIVAWAFDTGVLR